MRPEDFWIYPIDQGKPITKEEIVSLVMDMTNWRVAFNIVIDHGCSDCNEWGVENVLQLDPGSKVYVGDKDSSIWDLLVLVKAFSSKTSARKLWKGPDKIPPGYTEWRINKKDPKVIWIWNPIECLCGYGESEFDNRKEEYK